MDTSTHTDQMPATIRAFVEAHLAHDAESALPLLSQDAVIVDDGTSYTGHDALHRFITEAGTEFSYTDNITDVRLDGGTWIVAHHLEGDFPGGVVDLDYRFTLSGEQIGRLEIVAV